MASSSIWGARRRERGDRPAHGRRLGLRLDHVRSAVSVGIEDRVIRVDSRASLADYRDLLLRFYPGSAAGIDRIMALIARIMKDMDVLYGIDNPLFKDVLRDRAYLFGTPFPLLSPPSPLCSRAPSPRGGPSWRRAPERFGVVALLVGRRSAGRLPRRVRRPPLLRARRPRAGRSPHEGPGGVVGALRRRTVARGTVKAYLDTFFARTTYEVSIPVLKDPSLAPPGKTGVIVSCLFDYRLTRRIREAGWYDGFREACADAMTAAVAERLYPGLGAKVLSRFMTTSVTLRHARATATAPSSAGRSTLSTCRRSIGCSGSRIPS